MELSTVVNENAAVMLIYIPGNSKRKRKTFNLVTKFSILTLINLAVSTQDLPKANILKKILDHLFKRGFNFCMKDECICTGPFSVLEVQLSSCF